MNLLSHYDFKFKVMSQIYFLIVNFLIFLSEDVDDTNCQNVKLPLFLHVHVK